MCHAALAPHATVQTDPGAPVGVKRRCFLELQWQGRGGKFRHLALRLPALRRVLGALGIIVLLAVAVVAGFFVVSNRAAAQSSVAAALRENLELKARQDALRERAFDVAEQLYWHVEQERRMARQAGFPGHAWINWCPPPPGRNAGDEVILAWLSEQGAQLEALGNELAASRAEAGARQAHPRAPVGSGTVFQRHAATLQAANTAPGRRPQATLVAR